MIFGKWIILSIHFSMCYELSPFGLERLLCFFKVTATKSINNGFNFTKQVARTHITHLFIFGGLKFTSGLFPSRHKTLALYDRLHIYKNITYSEFSIFYRCFMPCFYKKLLYPAIISKRSHYTKIYFMENQL